MYYEVAARLGHLQSQFELGNLYYDGGYNLERDYMTAYKWYQVIHPVREGEISSAGDYGVVALYNVLSLGGTVHWGFYEDIEGLATQKLLAMTGWGLFNLSKGSKKEREQARQDALIIRSSIPVYQAQWKQ